MILVDTSIWVDHLRGGDAHLAHLLETTKVMVHPFVIGEVALGNLRNRTDILTALQGLPVASVAHDDEVLHLIDRRGLAGAGIGYLDAHLLASVTLTPDAALWTRDKRLLAVAKRLSLATGDRP